MAKTKGKAEVSKNFSTLEKLAVEYVPTGSLKPNAYNPNRQDPHDFDLLMASMTEDGFTQPIVVLPDMTIVDGEHRWRAASRLGYDEVPVVKVDMTPEQARISTLRHNRARGSEDLQLTAEVLRDLEKLGALDWAQDSLMLDDLEIQRLLDDIPAPEALAGDEWSEAWDPRPSREAGTFDHGKEEVENTEAVTGGGIKATNAATASAIDAQRDRERRIAEAKTQEERDRAIQERSQLFRLSLLFHGEEAELVKRVLHERAAERLVAILADWEERHGPEKVAEVADEKAEEVGT